MVTHDVDEALFMSDRVVMMTTGPRARIGEILEVPFRPSARAHRRAGASRILRPPRTADRLPRRASPSPRNAAGRPRNSMSRTSELLPSDSALILNSMLDQPPPVRRSSTRCWPSSSADGGRAVRAAARGGPCDRSQHAQYYRDLIPLSAPQPGEQYAFEVDLDACSGCKACVTACHSLNGLDEGETFRDVGRLIGRDSGGTMCCSTSPRPAITAWSRLASRLPDAGLRKRSGHRHRAASRRPVHRLPVLHADVPLRRAQVQPGQGHRPQVRHVPPAADRGEAPACVQACPNQAIRIEIVRREVAYRPVRGGPVPARFARPAAHAADHAVRHAPPAAARCRRRRQRTTGPRTRTAAGRHARAHADVGRHVPCVAKSDRSGRHALTPPRSSSQRSSVLSDNRPRLAPGPAASSPTAPGSAGERAGSAAKSLSFGLFSAMAAAFVCVTLLPGLPLAAAGCSRGWAWQPAWSAWLAVLCSAMIYVATRREFWSSAPDDSPLLAHDRSARLWRALLTTAWLATGSLPRSAADRHW